MKSIDVTLNAWMTRFCFLIILGLEALEIALPVFDDDAAESVLSFLCLGSEPGEAND